MENKDLVFKHQESQEEYFKRLREQSNHQEPTPEETEQAKSQADKNLSKLCEGYK